MISGKPKLGTVLRKGGKVDLVVSGGCEPSPRSFIILSHVTPDVHSSLWVMHSDGSGLRPLTVPPSSGCGGPNADPLP